MNWMYGPRTHNLPHHPTPLSMLHPSLAFFVLSFFSKQFNWLYLLSHYALMIPVGVGGRGGIDYYYMAKVKSDCCKLLSPVKVIHHGYVILVGNMSEQEHSTEKCTRCIRYIH